MSDILQTAHNHRLSGEYEQAEAAYREVLACEPANAQACWGLAHTLMNQGEFEACEVCFLQAIELDGDNCLFLLDAAKYFTMLGEYEKARPFFEQVVAQGTDDRLVSEAKKQLSYF
jgi:Flp pilus assembly protein TadD